MIFLRQVRWQQNDVGGRRGERTADREAAYFLGSRKISLQQRRRELPDRDVVEPVARVVFRQERRDVDVDAEQIADRVLILGAIQPAEGLGAPWIGRRGCGAIEGGLEQRDERLVRRLVGPGLSWRRHHADAQLPHDFFPRRRLLAHPIDVERCQRQPGGLDLIVMTGEAVLLERRPRRGR